MKKAILVIISALLLLSGCGYSNKDMEQAKKDAYQEGYRDGKESVEDINSSHSRDMFDQGYRAALDDYAYVEFECPNCGEVYFVSTEDGSIY